MPDAVVGAAKPGREVAKDAVDVRQELGRLLGGALGPGAMPVAPIRQRRIRPPAIRQDEGAGRDSPLHQSCQRASRCVRHKPGGAPRPSRR